MGTTTRNRWWCFRCRIVGYRLTVAAQRWPRLHDWLAGCRKCERFDFGSGYLGTGLCGWAGCMNFSEWLRHHGPDGDNHGRHIWPLGNSEPIRRARITVDDLLAAEAHIEGGEVFITHPHTTDDGAVGRSTKSFRSWLSALRLATRT